MVRVEGMKRLALADRNAVLFWSNGRSVFQSVSIGWAFYFTLLYIGLEFGCMYKSLSMGFSQGGFV